MDRRTERPDAGTSIRTRGGSLAPGGVVGDGRYRLLAQLGVDDRTGAHLWRARDGQLRRDVALTLIVGDAVDPDAAQAARRTLERAAHAAQFNHTSVARVLDVLSLGSGITPGEGLLGIVVAEWSKGTDLIDVVDNGPITPSTACRMVDTLVNAVEQAHNNGLVLGLDHPQRIRVTPEGSLRLAFPGPLPDATMRDDIKALGAILYLLLTARWPLPGGPSAIQPAPQGPDGQVVAPHVLSSWVPPQLSSLAVRTMTDSGGIRTSSAFRTMLRQSAAYAEHEELVQSGQIPAYDNEDPDGGVWTTSRPNSDAAQRKKVAIGATVLVVLTVAIMAWAGLSLLSFFDTDEDASGPDVNVAENSKAADDKKKQKKTKTPDSTGKSITPAEVRVYNPEGTGDHEELAGQAIDGNPETLWTTDQYKQQLPALKTGVGLAVTFDQPVDLAKVEVLAATPGTKVEVRTAQHPNPILADSSVVVPASDVQGEQTALELSETAKATHVIVWVTQLGSVDGQFQSTIGELKFYPASQP